MNKNTTDITLSAYFNDIVIGYYEDEDLVKQFGRQLGFDVDMDTFMAVSFQYPSDMNVKPEDREKLTDAANAMIFLPLSTAALDAGLVQQKAEAISSCSFQN